MTDLLNKARIYEEEREKSIPFESRPFFHFTPRAGWMNDPNGFSCYRGEYHLFYQYYPYDTCWGPMHWGHAASKDMIRWEYLPAVLAPDREYDREGCWSGSATTLSDGRQLLVYTGRQPVTGDAGEEIFQVQCLAVGDGREYHKSEENPVISASKLPEGASLYDFRDPKIWQEDDGIFYLITGNRGPDGRGQILLYRSGNGFSWDFVSVLCRGDEETGMMWECPDFFEMGENAFLLLSPQDMKTKGEFQNSHGNVYIRGKYDRDRHVFLREEMHPVDYGHDFYAPQTMKTEDGRRVMIAWMQSWENARTRDYLHEWAGMMTVPRELEVRDGFLIQRPVRELMAYRKKGVVHRNMTVSGTVQPEGVRGRCIDMTVHLTVPESQSFERFTLKLAEGEMQGQEYALILTYDREEGKISLDRSRCGYGEDAFGERVVLVGCRNDLSFRVLLDRYSAEFFIDDGRYTISSVIGTPQELDGISFDVCGNAVMDVEIYPLGEGEGSNDG